MQRPGFGNSDNHYGKWLSVRCIFPLIFIFLQKNQPSKTKTREKQLESHLPKEAQSPVLLTDKDTRPGDHVRSIQPYHSTTLWIYNKTLISVKRSLNPVYDWPCCRWLICSPLSENQLHLTVQRQKWRNRHYLVGLKKTKNITLFKVTRKDHSPWDRFVTEKCLTFFDD